MPALAAYHRHLDYSYATGFYPAMECLLHQPERVRRVLLSSDAEGTEAAGRLIELADRLGKRIEIADRVLEKVSGKENCHAAVVFAKQEQTLNPARAHVVLHHPSDSGNLGTIIRSALGFGMEDLALITPCVDVYDPKTVRASMGSLFQMRVQMFDSMEAYIAAFPEHALYLFMLRQSRPMLEVLQAPLKTPFSLVFGNEGSGLPDTFCTLGSAVRIESNDRVDSLNLSVAAAIGCYAFMQKAYAGGQAEGM